MPNDVPSKSRHDDSKIHRLKCTDETKAAWRAQFSLQRSTFQRLHAEYWSAAIQECPDSRTLWRKFDSLLLQPSRQAATAFTADDIASHFSSKIDAIRLTTATVPPPVPVQPFLDFDDEVAKLLKTVAEISAHWIRFRRGWSNSALTSWSQSSLLWSIYPRVLPLFRTVRN